MRLREFLLSTVAIGFALGVCVVAAGDVPPDGWIIQGWPMQVGDRFGASVGLDGRTIVVGAPSSCPEGCGGSGRAYLFRNDGWGWSQVQELDSVARRERQRFGCSVAVAGDIIMVGADGAAAKDKRTGAVFVFHDSADAYNPHDVLIGADAADGDCFGFAVAMDRTSRGVVAAVGAPGRDLPGTGEDVGAVYVMRRIQNGTWMQEQCIVVPGAVQGDGWGARLAISGDALIVAGTGDSVWIFRDDGLGWEPEAELALDVGTETVGLAVAIDGDDAAVGVPTLTGGSVHIFRFAMSSWRDAGVIMPVVDELLPAFGRAVSLQQDSILIGGTDRAWVYASVGPGWGVTRRLGDFELDSSYGAAVALDGTTAVVGASSAYEFGAVIAYTLAPVADVDGDGLVDVLDLLAVLEAWGPCESCPEDLNGDGTVGVGDLLLVLEYWTGTEK